MADSGSGADNSGEYVNLLYLASKRREQSDANKNVKNAESNSTGSHAASMDSSNVESTRVPSGPSSNNQEQPRGTRLTKLSSTSVDERRLLKICPQVNCPEKIILCLDFSEEMEKVTFRSRAGDKFAPIKLVKRAVGIFLHSKHKLNPKHEFALVILREQAYLMFDFTNRPDKIIGVLNELDTCFPVDSCDLTHLFDTILERVNLPRVENPSKIPPPYVVRTILLYGRSQCVPEFSNKESFKMLTSSPYFFLDIFYIHESPSNENRCETIFDMFCEFDEGLYYIFEVSRNPTKLYDCMAQLLAHPLQRPIQTDACYTIETKT